MEEIASTVNLGAAVTEGGPAADAGLTAAAAGDEHQNHPVSGLDAFYLRPDAGHGSAGLVPQCHR